ncbi:hypothetical protein V6N13_127397 [Hibiscus sabdariffa]|uniref:Uncharacterized protein n=1 Tax=Hibiscus sabdariffa TaxID=183260 RepID=A0ABR2RD63_9ROSI
MAASLVESSTKGFNWYTQTDELPPLPLPPPGNFAFNHQMDVSSTSQEAAAASQSNKRGLKTSCPDAFSKAKCKQVARETTNGKDDWNKRIE